MSKNFLISIIILLTIILLSLGLYFVLENKNSKTKLALENKIRCEKYTEAAKKDADDMLGVIESFSGNSHSFGQIFFSPIENSCLYTVQSFDKEGVHFNTIVRDVLTHQTVELFSIYGNDDENVSDFTGSPSKYKKFLLDRNAWN